MRLLYLILAGLCCMVASLSARPLFSASTTPCPPGRIIRIAGQLVEQATGRPLGRATVMVKCGEHVLANKQSDAQGNFVLYIPPEKVGNQRIDLKIKYREHVFLKRQIEPVSQELRVEINRAILQEEAPIGDYSMPFHLLEQPQVGRVVIRRASPPAADLHRVPATVEL